MADQYDAILVLSCGITPAGELTDDARSSTELAVEQFKQGAASLLIFSGSYSYKADFVPPTTEAEAMRDYAISLGVPAEAILVETDSKDTLGNVYFTKKQLLEPHNLHRLFVVGGPNHSLERLQFLFRKVLGPAYAYQFAERPPRPAEQTRERGSLAILERWLGDIADGDDAAVHAVMLARHPGYSSNPQALADLLREINEIKSP